jgi:hypothetical protein
MSMQTNALKVSGFLNYELESIKFLERCLQKTNQFSAKYILQKVLSDQKRHLSAIDNDLRHLDTLLPEVLISISDLQSNLEIKFDLKTLNFVEATKLAIYINEQQLSVYGEYLMQKLNASVQEGFDRLLKGKKARLRALHKEYERLRYKG